MEDILKTRKTGGLKRIVPLVALFLLAPAARIAVGDAADGPDTCELEARRAYCRALELCRLAETGNPRIRCFEAAKAVYLQTLQDCRRGQE